MWFSKKATRLSNKKSPRALRIINLAICTFPPGVHSLSPYVGSQTASVANGIDSFCFGFRRLCRALHEVQSTHQDFVDHNIANGFDSFLPYVGSYGACTRIMGIVAISSHFHRRGFRRLCQILIEGTGHQDASDCHRRVYRRLSSSSRVSSLMFGLI